MMVAAGGGGPRVVGIGGLEGRTSAAAAMFNGVGSTVGRGAR